LEGNRPGYELFGYWSFFSEEGAHKIVEAHVGSNSFDRRCRDAHSKKMQVDSYFSAVFPNDPKLWVTDVAHLRNISKLISKAPFLHIYE
jgi:hypothetical protein